MNERGPYRRRQEATPTKNGRFGLSWSDSPLLEKFSGRGGDGGGGGGGGGGRRLQGIPPEEGYSTQGKQRSLPQIITSLQLVVVAVVVAVVVVVVSSITGK